MFMHYKSCIVTRLEPSPATALNQDEVRSLHFDCTACGLGWPWAAIREIFRIDCGGAASNSAPSI
jgi:hypothetical protein